MREKILPKVTILLSTYNGSMYIEKQINSLINQTYSNTKILIRDDGSTDNTNSILDKYKHYTNIKVLQVKRLFFPNERNIVTKQAGEFYELYKDMLPPEEIKMINYLLYTRRSLLYRLKFLFSFKNRQTILDTLVLKILVLLNRL